MRDRNRRKKTLRKECNQIMISQKSSISFHKGIITLNHLNHRQLGHINKHYREKNTDDVDRLMGELMKDHKVYAKEVEYEDQPIRKQQEKKQEKQIK